MCEREPSVKFEARTHIAPIDAVICRHAAVAAAAAMVRILGWMNVPGTLSR